MRAGLVLTLVARMKMATSSSTRLGDCFAACFSIRASCKSVTYITGIASSNSDTYRDPWRQLRCSPRQHSCRPKSHIDLAILAKLGGHAISVR